MSLTYNGKYHLPAPTGNYVVGFTDIMTGPGLEGCFIRLFYPSNIQDPFVHHEKWAPWIPHPKYNEGYASVFGVFPAVVKHVCAWAFGSTYIPIVQDARPATQKFPLVIFSHGLSACRTTYSTFCSDIASHGFIVAAIEHRDASACLSYAVHEGGTEEWIPYVRIRFESTDFELRQRQLEHRIQECRRTLDFLHELNSGQTKSQITLSSMNLKCFQGLMDLTKVGISGHSFGGATLLRTLAVDKRFKFGLVLDSWMWPLKQRKDLCDQVEQPLLFINMEAFQSKPNLKYMNHFLRNENGAERRVVTLRGSVHQNQCDTAILLPPYLRRFAGCHSTIDPHLAMTLNNRLSLLFLWKHSSMEPKKEYVDFIESHQDWCIDGIDIADQ